MDRKLKILMLEDMEEDAWLVDRALQKGNISFTRLRVDTRDEFTNALDTFVPDVILSDHSLPQFNSMEALEICRSKEVSVPFLLVTGAVSEEFAVSCLKKGADDYVLKSNVSRLPLAIHYAIKQRNFENAKREQVDSLRLQNEELKKQYRDLDLVVHSAWHNMRAPLRSVLGLINLSRYELNSGNVQAITNYFQMMESSIGQLDNTLKLILDHSRNCRLDEEVEEINFEEMFQNIFASVKFINDEHAITHEITVSGAYPFRCNKMRLNLVLLNLISNAVKYYDPLKKHPFINVKVYLERDGVKIFVEDNGIGISENLQPRVFDMFYRATNKSEGSGLGLYIVKETLFQMNGSIFLMSEEGKGTTFRISIPDATGRD